MHKQWVKIKNYEDEYEINQQGEIRVTEDHVVGRRTYFKKGDLISVCKGAYGYMVCSLRKNGVNKMVKVHRLLAEAFIPNPHNKPQINHIDNNRTNNKLSNLEWCTQAENDSHKLSQGRQPHGETHYNSKLSNDDILFIRNFESESTLSDLVNIFNMSKSHMRNIRDCRKWRHLHAPQ